MHVILDTETSGKAQFKLPPKHPSQPHIVQLGAILLDNDFKVRGEINLIVKPDGWEIPTEASDIHGITTQMAHDFGVPIHKVLSAFFDLWKSGNVLVAHNVSFDKMMMDIELTRQGATPIEAPEQTFCTMHATTALCKIPGNYGDFKWPKLTEAYQHIFQESFDGAHDAMADVRACARIYRWLKEQKSEPIVSDATK